jgi:UDP-glucose:(heptosyl)LPS alpha-1,3-glucosyltransferase
VKIALLIRRYLTTGGAERYAVEVAQRLARKHEVHVFAHEFEGEAGGNIFFHRVPRPFRKPAFVSQWWFAWWTGRNVRGFDVVHTHERATRFDVMHVHSGTFVGGLFGVPGGQRKNPFRVWLKILTEPRVWAYWHLEKKHYRPQPGRSWIAVSKMIQREVQNFYPIPDDRFAVAHPGTDLPATDTVAARKIWREKLSVADGETLLVFVGSEFKRKGLDALIAALALLKNQPVKLTVVGGGDVETYQQQAAALGVGGKIFWAGLVKNTSDFYAAADIFVLPTLSDAGPMSPLEAMAHGCPAIFSCAKFAGMAEMITHGEAILLNNPKDASEIAVAIEKLMNPAERENFIRKGRALAEKLSWDRTAALVEAALEKSARERGLIP